MFCCMSVQFVNPFSPHRRFRWRRCCLHAVQRQLSEAQEAAKRQRVALEERLLAAQRRADAEADSAHEARKLADAARADAEAALAAKVGVLIHAHVAAHLAEIYEYGQSGAHPCCRCRQVMVTVRLLCLELIRRVLPVQKHNSC